jgi:plasmid segregation protein ParM
MEESRMKKYNCLLAVDLGYGNVKSVCGDAEGKVLEMVLPAGAAPADQMPKLINRQADLKGGELVLVPSEGSVVPWVAGVDQIVVQHGTRQSHDRYIFTPEYHALFLGALARQRCDRVNLLVTGLPVSQFYGERGESLRRDLQKLMTGRHHINEQTTVEVERTLVIPQPTGTFMGVATQPEYSFLVTDESLTTLTVDVGYFSVDWVLMSGRSVRDKSSGSSQLATSHILEEGARELSRRLDRYVDRDRLDAAYRSGAKQLRIGGEELDYLTLLTQTGVGVSRKVVGQVQDSLRNDNRGVDVVILTGGGAELYAAELAKVFPKAKFIRPADPVLSNARGYFAYGQLVLGSSKAA